MSYEYSTHASFLARRNFRSLDGLRCLSIVPVVFHHSSDAVTRGGVLALGFLGVDMFFVISGFLITSLLLRERRSSGDVSLRRFYIRRALRILPLYYGIVLGCAVLLAALAPDGSTARAYFGELPFYLTYTTNWVPITTFLAISWSLSAEEQFYFVWPPIETYVRRPLVALAFAIGVSIAIAWGWLDPLFASAGIPLPTGGMLRETTFVPILLGVALAHALDDRAWFDRLAPALGGSFVSTMLLALLLVEFAVAPADLRGMPRTVIQATMTLFVASTVIPAEHRLGALLESKPFVRIGAVSYGIYLFHMLVVHGTKRLVEHGLPTAATFPVTLAVTYVVAEISYRYYEMPFLRLKARFESERADGSRATSHAGAARDPQSSQ